MMKHLVVAIVVEALAGTAGLIRVMRGCLLDELRKPYVVTARSKGLDEQKLLFKYPIRIAINPLSAPSAGCCRESSQAAPSWRSC